MDEHTQQMESLKSFGITSAKVIDRFTENIKDFAKVFMDTDRAMQNLGKVLTASPRELNNYVRLLMRRIRKPLSKRKLLRKGKWNV